MLFLNLLTPVQDECFDFDEAFSIAVSSALNAALNAALIAIL